ncbi:YadA-like family protein [Erythrobacter sp. Alg231-14]|uniref:YadA-like family protein n=1 Tax=Erythrobacter sp. Alg231-14 TaxID=1922225 RepID=UPI000D5523C3
MLKLLLIASCGAFAIAAPVSAQSIDYDFSKFQSVEGADESGEALLPDEAIAASIPALDVLETRPQANSPIISNNAKGSGSEILNNTDGGGGDGGDGGDGSGDDDDDDDMREPITVADNSGALFDFGPNGEGAVQIELSGANGDAAIGIGRLNSATGDASLAIGFRNTTQDIGSVAMGARNTAAGDGALAIGADNSANGVGSVSLGADNIANGEGAVAIASGAQANGEGAVALGNDAVASADGAVAIGPGAIADETNLIALGSSIGRVRVASIPSELSRAAQQGALSLVTTDAFGNLASLSIDPNGLVGLQDRLGGIEGRLDGAEGRLDGLDSRLDGVDGRLGALELSSARNRRYASGGIAAAIALSGTTIIPDKDVSMSFNLANFDGEQGFSTSIVTRITDEVYISGGVTGSTVRGTTAGRVGLSFGF